MLVVGCLLVIPQAGATGSGPEVGYLKAGRMMMGSVRAVPVKLPLPGLSATIAVWNSLTIPGHTMQTDQPAVFSARGASVNVPAHIVTQATR